MDYDVIVVGAGPAGIFTCYELMEHRPRLRVLLIDKGHDIYRRHCPILQKRLSKCPAPAQKEGSPGCFPSCSITNGFGGAGAYSDGKFNITTEFGGWMTDYLPPSTVMELIQYVDGINIQHGAASTVTDPTTEKVRDIERKGLGAGLKLLRARVRHLGTEQNLEILKSLYEHLKPRVDMAFSSEVRRIVAEEESGELTVRGIETAKGQTHTARYVVATPGRDGSEWLAQLLQEHGLSVRCNHVDVGVRVETLDTIMEELNENLYEAKFVYNTSVGTTVRSFCSNPSGHVVIENHSGVMLANGHAFKDKALGSCNTNFALLVSHSFSYPFNRPNEYAKFISRLANDLSGGSVLIQKYGDILKGRRSTEKRIREGFVEPTLKEAIPGNLGLALPYTTMQSIMEMIEALDKVTPGLASEHTLLYGVEAKFYSARPTLTHQFETEIQRLYAGGDGAGVNRGLAQASACGIHIARNIVARFEAGD